MQNMNTPMQNSEEIEAAFIQNKQDNDAISELLNRLQGHESPPECTQHASLTAASKLTLTKQQLENNDFVSDRQKTHMCLTETGGKKKKNTDQNAFHHSPSMGMNDTEIGKTFGVSRCTAIRWIKEHNLSNL